MCQKCYDKCPKDGKFDKLVAKKLTVCKQANFKGDVTIDGQFCLKDPVTISVPDIHSGADLFKPTIQEAIDYFKGRHAMCGKIVLKQNHKYFEKSLHLDKFMASRTDSEIDGFSIQGDTRPIASATYLRGGFFIPNPERPDIFTSVNLVSGPNTVQVVLGTGDIDFSASGIVPGDKIKLRDTGKNWYLRNVVSVAGNTITYDGDSVQVGGYASALVMVPNVEILVTELSTLKALAFVGNLSATFKGLWLNGDVSRGSVDGLSQLTILDHGQLKLVNCLLETAGNGKNNVLIRSNGTLIGQDGFGTNRLSTFLTSGSENGIFTNTGGNVNTGEWNFFDGQIAIYLEINGGGVLNCLQCVGQTSSSLDIESSTVRYFGSGRFLQTVTGILIASSQVNVNFTRGNFIIDCSDDGSTSEISRRGLIIVSNSSVSIENGFTNSSMVIKNCGVGIFNFASSTTYFEKWFFFFSNNTLNVLTEEAAPVSNGSLKGNTYVYDGVDPGVSIKFENAYPKQEFKTCGGSIVELTLDPSETIFSNLYEGKTFTLSSADDLPHRLSLINGGKFVGLANGTVADFSSVGDFIQFTVLPVNDCGDPVYNVLLTSKSAGVTIV